MKLMLDTQLIYWWQTGDSKLSAATRTLITNNLATVFVSKVSLWELAIKANVGKLKINLPIFAAQVDILGFSWLPIETEHILAIEQLPTFPDHKDPFDRLLVAQSISEPLILLTADIKLARYGSTVRVV